MCNIVGRSLHKYAMHFGFQQYSFQKFGTTAPLTLDMKVKYKEKYFMYPGL